MMNSKNATNEIPEPGVRYPQNLYLKDFINERGIRHNWLADKLGISRSLLSRLIYGHYKGPRLVAKIHELIGDK